LRKKLTSARLVRVINDQLAALFIYCIYNAFPGEKIEGLSVSSGCILEWYYDAE
jgi:hypothetical protein